MDFVFDDLAVFQLANHCGGTQADFVHAVFAVNHQRMLSAQPLQGAHLNTDQVGVKHAHQNMGRAGRVGQRAQDVEDGAHAELFADGRDVFHGRVVVGREHEADADLLNTAGNGVGL